MRGLWLVTAEPFDGLRANGNSGISTDTLPFVLSLPGLSLTKGRSTPFFEELQRQDTRLDTGIATLLFFRTVILRDGVNESASASRDSQPYR